jgi:hypothetical protein
LGALSIVDGDHPFNQCSAGTGASVGAELRTRGRWLLAAGLDLFSHFGVNCTLQLITTTFEGQEVTVTSSAGVSGPRLSVHTGWAIPLGELIVEPAVGAGVLYASTQWAGDSDVFWSEWYGGSIRFRTAASPALGIEYGWREMPFGFYRGSERVHAFGEREPLFRAVMEF